MEASVALQRSVGIDTRLVSPVEMREIEPRLRAEDLVAGCYEPASGYCNPVETAQGFARAARAAGARILEDTAVVGLLVEGDRVRGVRTAAGDIHAPVVLNAAGLWSAPVAAMAGVELPIHVCRHRISIVTWPQAEQRPHRCSTTSSTTSTRARRWASTSSWAGSTPRSRAPRRIPTPTRRARAWTSRPMRWRA